MVVSSPINKYYIGERQNPTSAYGGIELHTECNCAVIGWLPLSKNVSIHYESNVATKQGDWLNES
jgi:hypothetical protein